MAQITKAHFEALEQRRSLEDLKFLVDALKVDGVIEIVEDEAVDAESAIVAPTGPTSPVEEAFYRSSAAETI